MISRKAGVGLLHTGLLSITFRGLSAERIVGLAAEAGLEGLEWGGDIHVPHGDVERAREVAAMTADAGLKVAAYGSYFRVSSEPVERFDGVLAAAVALGAPTVRVWAGGLGSLAADEAWRERVAGDLRRIADVAAREGVTVSLEHHSGTLTDTTESAVALLTSVAHPNVRTLWQPPVPMTFAERLDGVKRAGPWLTNLHVYHWDGGERRPLEEGADDWAAYLRAAAAVPGDRYAMLEFVRDDDPARFVEDAATLKRLVAAANGGRSEERAVDC